MSPTSLATILGTTIYDASGWSALSARPGWSAALIGATLLAIAAAVFFGWRERSVAPRGAFALLALRLAAIVAAVTLVLGIERRELTEIEEPSRVVLLVDHSASMTFPSGADISASPTRAELVAPAIESLFEALGDRHRVRTASFAGAVEYGATDAASNGATTRLGEALRRVALDHATTPLAAVIVASDGGWNSGTDPLEAVEQVSRGVPVHTLGVGPLREPPSVGLRDLAAPSRASSDDAFRVRVTVAANATAALAGAPHHVRVAIRPIDEEGHAGEIVAESDLDIDSVADSDGGELVSGSIEMDGLPSGAYEITAGLTPAGRDADPTDNELTTAIEFVDVPTRVLLAAGGPSRDYRFLRDGLYRDDLFTCDVLLQTATGAVTQDAGRVLDALPATIDEWEEYDALVAIDVDWRRIDVTTLQAVADWVSQRGGGLVFLSGPVVTPSVTRTGVEPPLRTLLPVKLRDDPLGFVSTAGRDASPVRLEPAGSRREWMALETNGPNAAAVWSELDGFYGSTLPAEPKPAATLLATLGGGAEPRPLYVEQLYGAGRVFYGATAQTWRLRQVSPESFTAFHVGLLRHVTQGRLLGADAIGGLLFDRQQYDLGETMTLRFLPRTAVASESGALVARVGRNGEAPTEVGLAPVDGQNGVFAAAVQAEGVGKHFASLLTATGDQLTASAEVTLPELEKEARVQNVPLLQEIASRTGGRYVDLADASSSSMLQQLAAETPSQAETRIELGPPDERFARSISRLSLGVMAGALLLEWLLRRSWRLS